MGILFFDIDDTLFSHQTFTIPESTHEALVRARANGHHLVLASGRGHSGIVDLYDDTLFEGAVCCSGGCVFWNDELIIDHPIPQDKAAYLIQLAEQYESGISVQGKLESWQNNKVMEVMRRVLPKSALKKRMHMQSLSQRQEQPIYKVDYFFPDLEHAQALLAKLPEDLNICVFPDAIGKGSGCEVSANGVSKGSGITELLNWLGIDRSDSYAFGDSENDIEMLKSCGTGIAMGNGVQAIKDCADYITSGVDDNGIWNAMKHFGLIE